MFKKTKLFFKTTKYLFVHLLSSSQEDILLSMHQIINHNQKNLIKMIIKTIKIYKKPL